MISDRKLEHLLFCAHYDVQYKNKTTGFEDIEFIHRALPEVNKENIDLSTELFGKELKIPLIISAMTGGHPSSLRINKELAIAAEKLGMGMGLGSQRAGIEHPELVETYKIARDVAPNILLIGNIGAPQIDMASDAVDMVDADVLAIHLNPLQESIQPEGDINSEGVIDSIGAIVDSIDIPVIVKETGAGINMDDAYALSNQGIAGIDVAGAGGTSWAAVETYRAEDSDFGKLFWDWGIPTAVSTIETRLATPHLSIISSGGIRSGLDMAKAIALGADATGIATPLLKAAYVGHEEVIKIINKYVESLKIAMFLVGASNLEELKQDSNLIIRGRTKEWLNAREIDTHKYARRG